MKKSQFLTLFLVAFSPNIGSSGDFSNPVPYGNSSAGSNQTSYSPVAIETAEALRIARMDIGTPNTVVNSYVQTNDQCINCVTVGDNATDVSIDATQDGTNACINVTNNILNAQNQAADAQSCGEIAP
jgi:hypothetical protein